MDDLRVGVLAYPGCFASEVFGVPDLLTMAAHLTAPDRSGYRVSVMSPRRRVVMSGGVAITPGAVQDVDVLVVPGFELATATGLDDVLRPLGPELAVLRAHAQAGRALVSICVGAFLLAEAGLLDRRRATTAWIFADELARRHPRIEVQADNLVVTDTGVTTTAAFSAMYDFALGLIRRHSGQEVAHLTARIALVDDARSSQSPYVEHRLLPRRGNAFATRVMRRLDQSLDDPYDLPLLAAAFGVSTRTMLRRFAEETGRSPLSYLQSARVRRAQHLLETTDQTVTAIAHAVGYRDVSTFAALFAKHTDRRPREYRATFGRAGDP